MSDYASTAGGEEAPRVRIRYRRPPDREEIFVQQLVYRTADAVVTHLERTPLARPIVVDGETVLEDGSPAVWFTFPGEWYDIGRFHLADGTFTGTYANVLTPVRFLDPLNWETTDLFLDVWIPPDGGVRVLDRDEFEDAVRRGWLEPRDAARARREAERLAAAATRGEWPPAMVEAWTLERVRRRLERRA